MSDSQKPFDALIETSGISQEDQEDILKHIEEVVLETRIKNDAATLTVSARKKGVFFPLVVNLVGIVFVGVGLFVSYLFFRQATLEIKLEHPVIQTAEGRLLEELRKDSDSQLLAKQRQIDEIQKKMESLDKERSELRTKMEAKIAQKERELQESLRQEIEAERQRLKALTYSEDILNKKLKEFEQKKTVEFERQLMEFIKKVDSERMAFDSNLQQQQSIYQKNLNDQQQEHQRILEEFKKSKTALKKQLAQALALQQNNSSPELDQAKTKLAQLNVTKEEAENIETQIQGLHLKIAEAIQRRAFSQALVQLESLLAYLDDEKVKSLPQIQQRRESNFSMAISLEDFLKEQLKEQKSDEAHVTITADVVTQIRDWGRLANIALREGKESQASDLYQKILDRVPEVADAHSHFLKKAQASQESRQQLLLYMLNEGNQAFKKKQFNESLRTYKEIIGFLPLSVRQKDDLWSSINSTAFEVENKSRVAQYEEKIKVNLSKAKKVLEKGQIEEATGMLMAIIETISPDSFDKNAIKEIRQAANIGAVQGSPLVLGLQEQYKIFKSQDDSIWKKASLNSALQFKVGLDRFLSSSEVNQTFPGLKDRFDRFEKTYREAARQEIMFIVQGALNNLIRLKTKTERKNYLDILEKRYSKNPIISDYLVLLKQIL